MRECLFEGDWKASPNGLVRNLADLSLGALRTHMSKKGELAVCVLESFVGKALTACTRLEFGS
jgi:hypothetical protein